ncbi:hypothetical protein SEPCBS119000_006701, partial [Sporothrix epigloea]
MPCTVASVPQVQPWFTLVSEDVFAFLHAQISRVCYLLEHLVKYDSGNRDQGLSAAIFLAVRLLKYSYSSGIMERDPLLFKSDWHPNRPRTLIMTELREIVSRASVPHDSHCGDLADGEFPDIEDLLSRSAVEVAEQGDGTDVEVSDDDAIESENADETNVVLISDDDIEYDIEYEDEEDHDSINDSNDMSDVRELPDVVLPDVETSDFENDEVDAGRLSSPSDSEYQDSEAEVRELSVDADSEYQWNECAQEELSGVDGEQEVALPLPRRTQLPTPKYETEESRARRELIGLGMNYSARKYGF